MEKRLIKKLSINYLFIGTIFVFLFSLIIYENSKKITFENCDEILNQVNISYENSKVNLKEKLLLYKEDLINRIYATDFILNSNLSMRDNEDLIKINSLMGFESINVVDNSGVIVLSTEKDSVGLNLLENQEARPLWNLIKGEGSEDQVIGLDLLSNKDNLPKVSFGIKSSMEDYSIIQVTISCSGIDKIKEEDSMMNILGNMPTTNATSIFAIDANTGTVLGATNNNKVNLTLNDFKSKEELLTLLKTLNKGQIVEIDGSYTFSKTKIVDNLIFLCSMDGSTVFYSLLTQILSSISITLIIFLTLILILKKHLKTYIFNDFQEIEDNIKKVISGKLNTTFQTENPEMESLITILNHWKDSYKNRTRKMSKIVGDVDSHIAMFECSYYLNTNFFSDNMQSVLGINSTEWNEMKENPIVFENYITGLLALADDEGIIRINNRYLTITPNSTDFEFSGLIVDKSHEIKSNKKFIKELKRAKSAAEKDNLTNVLNRKAFETSVKKFLAGSTEKGIMLIFDLDNFKQVNDILGHPEGDKVLKLMGSSLKKEFSEELIGRLGGDEFVAFLNNNLPKEALAVKLNGLLDIIRKNLSYYYENFHVSVSIGAAYVDTMTTYETLYKKADAALYIAKHSGKNDYYISDNTITFY